MAQLTRIVANASLLWRTGYVIWLMTLRSSSGLSGCGLRSAPPVTRPRLPLHHSHSPSSPGLAAPDAPQPNQPPPTPRRQPLRSQAAWRIRQLLYFPLSLLFNLQKTILDTPTPSRLGRQLNPHLFLLASNPNFVSTRTYVSASSAQVAIFDPSPRQLTRCRQSRHVSRSRFRALR